MITLIMSHIKSFQTAEDGATAIEYGLIAALVSVAAIAGFQALGGSLDGIFEGISGELDTAATGFTGAGGETPAPSE